MPTCCRDVTRHTSSFTQRGLSICSVPGAMPGSKGQGPKAQTTGTEGALGRERALGARGGQGRLGGAKLILHCPLMLKFQLFMPQYALSCRNNRLTQVEWSQSSQSRSEHIQQDL